MRGGRRGQAGRDASIADHQLVDGSIQVERHAGGRHGRRRLVPGHGQRDAGRDPRPGRAQGARPRPDRRRRRPPTLEPYGEVTITTWPDWVSSIPTMRGPGRAHHRRARPGGDAVAIADARDATRSGVDLGERRVGIAIADGDGIPARPLTTLRRARDLAGDVAALRALVEAHGIDELVVGLPLEASGESGRQAAITIAWADAVAADLRIAANLSRRAPDEPARGGPPRSDAARPVRRAALEDPARRLPGPRRSGGGGDHPPG